MKEEEEGGKITERRRGGRRTKNGTCERGGWSRGGSRGEEDERNEGVMVSVKGSDL